MGFALIRKSSFLAIFVSYAALAPVLAGTSSEPKDRISGWCGEVRRSIASLKWKVEACEGGLEWKDGGSSVKGRPLVYAEFGDPQNDNTTLVLSTIHGDEVTPLYLGIQLAHWVRQHPEVLAKSRIIIAPLVNPDSFFAKPRTRVNARGVDVNRNFQTRDWHTHAHRAWKTKFRSDRRRFPGSTPRSEPETVFQEDLIRKFRPNKILAIHAPLNFMDYDGPSQVSLARFSEEYVNECLRLRQKLKAISGGFFPGSLGNYAGQELGIPTLTLELPSANPAKAVQYWKQFSSGIRNMIEFKVPDFVSSRTYEHTGG